MAFQLGAGVINRRLYRIRRYHGLNATIKESSIILFSPCYSIQMRVREHSNVLIRVHLCFNCHISIVLGNRRYL